MPQEFYNEDEAEQILRLATRQSITGGMSRDDLLRTAAEAGVTEAQVLAAESQFREHQSESLLAERFWARQKGKFMKEVAELVSANAACLGIWWMTGHGYFWPGWVLFGTSLGLIDDIQKRLFRSSPSYQRSFVKWRERGAQDVGVEPEEEEGESKRRRQVVVGVHVGGKGRD